MKTIFCKWLLAIMTAVLVVGCASTEQGQSIDRANMADLASTGYALTAVEGAMEANPLGPILIPVKLMMGSVVEKNYNCADRAKYASTVNPIYYGLSCSNLAGFNLLIGAACGVGYHMAKSFLEPQAFDCSYEPSEAEKKIPEQLADKWSQGDTDALAMLWADNVKYESWVGIGKIRSVYQ